ncbi:MAG: cytochrome c oxidase subunit II [Planctomycetes bacterium]|nr:cytochrome c oxidase subunit II [Planctomycetota bacterium]
MTSFLIRPTILADTLLRESGSFWLPPSSSSTSPAVDRVFYLILGVCSFFFLLVVSTAVLFVVLYRRRPGREAQKTATHHNLLELTWSVIPLLIVIVIFYEGFVAYMQMQAAPPNSYEILVKAQKWNWFFTYPNGHIDNDLHVPAGQPVRLLLSSEDVIHSLSIPAFRVKMDCVPGRYTYIWFQCDDPGVYELYCTEYCGDSHSDMTARVVVHRPGEFEAWLEEAANFLKKLPPAEAGKYLFTRRCTQCHSDDGTVKTGPTLKGIFGQRHAMADGGTVSVDENYIRESILDPQAKVRQGFQPVMPTFKGILTDDEITYLIEYIKTLK